MCSLPRYGMLAGRPLRPGTRELEGAMTSISSLLEQAAAEHPEHAALRMDDLVLTYAQFREATGRMSTLLTSLGIEPGLRTRLGWLNDATGEVSDSP